MSEPSWAEVRAIFEAAVELAGEARDAYLAQHAASPALRREVLSLLEVDEAAERFERPLPIALPPGAGDDADALTDGDLVGSYRIVRVIGRGGMGIVYLGERADDLYHRQVAIKVVRPGPDIGGLAARFARERQTLAALIHPNIARLYDGGTTARGAAYFVMEYVEGGPIDAYCDEARLDVDARLRLFRAVCLGVQHAHENVIVHRDIKPDNILVARDGTPKLLDFGVAKLLTEDGTGDGRGLAPTWWLTPDYASPEQIAARANVTTATDVYSLGVLLYVLLTGRRPYELVSGPAASIEAQLARAVLTPPSVRVLADDDRAREAAARRGTTAAKLSARLAGDLDAIVARALSHDVASRYPTVEQLLRDLERHAAGYPVDARPPALRYLARCFARRHAAGLAIAAGVTMVLAGSMAALWWQATIAARERDVAQRRFEDVRQLARVFIFDVHDAIANVPGTTKARALMLDTATDYLQKLAREAGGNVALEDELAAAFLRVGDAQGLAVDAALGDNARAVDSYRRAAALAERRLQASASSQAKDADDAARLTLARAHRRLSDVLPLMGDKAGGLASSERSLQLYAQRAARPGATMDDRMQAALAHIKLGDLLGNPQSVNLGRPAEAQQQFEVGVAALRALAAQAPDDLRIRRNLAAALQRIAGMHEHGARWAEAEAAYQEAFALVKGIAAASPSPLSPQLQRDLAMGHSTLARVQRATHRLGEAAASYREARARLQAMLDADPENAQALVTLAGVHELLGGTLVESGEAEAGIRSIREAVALQRGIASRKAAGIEARCSLASALQTLGDAWSTPAAARVSPQARAEACRAWTESRTLVRAAVAESPDACAADLRARLADPPRGCAP